MAFLRVHRLELVLLLGTVAAPLVTVPWGALLLLVLGLAWWSLRPPRHEAVLMTVALLLAAAALTTGWALDLLPRLRSEESWSLTALERYEGLLLDLKQQAARVAEEIDPPSAAPGSRLEAFHRLGDRVRRRPQDRVTLLLLDPDGEAMAWAGEGLLHSLSPEPLPDSGTYYFASYTAATLLAVKPLDKSRRPWRVVAGRSFPTDELPFAPPLGELRTSFRWSLVSHSSGEGSDYLLTPRTGQIEGEEPALPAMVIDRKLAAPGHNGHPLGSRSMMRVAWGIVGLALLTLAVLRGAGVAFSGRRLNPVEPDPRAGGVAVAVVAGVLAWGLAAGVPLSFLPVLVLGLLAAALAFRAGLQVPGPAVAGLLAGGGLLLLTGGAAAYQLVLGPLDLGSHLGVGPEGLALKLALWSFAFCVLCLARTRTPAKAPSGRWVWVGLALLLLAGSVHDFGVAGMVFLGLGGGAVAVWVGCGERLREVASVGVLVLLAALAAAGSWETAYRVTLRHSLSQEVLPNMAPLSSSQLDELARQLESSFASQDLDGLLSGDPWELERQDLALAVWRGSPLARSDARSSLIVEPFDGQDSLFTYGSQSPGLEVEEAAGRWRDGDSAGWEQKAASGTVELRWSGQPWAMAHYWLEPQPGFGVGTSTMEELELELLRGGPELPSNAGRLPGSALSALYTAKGKAIFTPWEGDPSLASELLEKEAALVATPVGRAFGWTRGHGSGATIQALYLPLLSPLDGLERTATHAVSTLLFLGLCSLLALVLALLRSGFRQTLRRGVRSYSKRLLIVFTLLLILPLALLNGVLFQSLGERLQRDQRAAGERALSSARRVLGDYVFSLEPGFAIDTELDDELLRWLSQVVHHEINVYWDSSIRNSSKPELFTAGLLPRRIPGEIFSRLDLSGYSLASRTNRAGRTSYLELYAPLAGQSRLFLSIPLLAQQEEVASELAQWARRALLVTTALFLLLVAVGTRLARSFATPLMQIVEGTGRIAGGATSLELAPSEPELASLVQAIDEMAGRIAEGRFKLLREKRVIEGMVENITSGVVSLDQNRRVLMRNRVAADLLGVQVGEDLGRIAQSPWLAPVATFLASQPRQVTRTTARLRPDEETEREWTLIWVPVPGEGDPAALLVVEDVTEVLRGQRLEAWAEMARIIAHEIKNPLTPIRLSTEHLRQVYATRPERFQEVFERCTDNILGQVQELYEIATEFSTYSHFPRTQPEPGDLVVVVSGIVEGYRAAPPEGVKIRFRAVPEEIPADFDGKLLGRAVRNLVENALRASSGGGEVSIRVEGKNGLARIAVTDEGPGVAPEHLARIFDPYFSTHSGGAGLGLPIARRIAEEHGGEITAHNRNQGGLEVAITIPISEGPTSGGRPTKVPSAGERP